MSTGALFDAVLSGIIETYSSSIEAAFRKYEPILSSSMPEEEFDIYFEKLFITMPENIAGYWKIVKTVTNFAKNSPSEILMFLTSKFKTECLKPIGTPFSLIVVSSLNFRLSNFYHFQFLRCLHLFILTDLIYNIIKNYSGMKGQKPLPLGKIIPCGFYACTPNKKLSRVTRKLIQKWGKIFHFISLTSTQEIATCMTQHMDDNNTENVFQLLSYVKGNQYLVFDILTATQQAKKKKTLTSDMLSSLAHLLTVTKCSDDILKELFNLSWGLRSSDNLKNGAIDLITAILPLIPSEKKRIPSFYKDRVYKHVSAGHKVERSAKAFLRLLRGSTSKAEIKEFYPEEYAGCSGQITDATSEFIKYFFDKANYSLCPDIFVEIYTQLAAIDTDNFTKLLLDQSLDHSGIVHNVALLTIYHINTDDFKKNSGITKEQLARINKIGRLAILSDLKIVKHTKTIMTEMCSISTFFGSTNPEVYMFISQNGLNFETEKEYTNTEELPCEPFSLQNAVSKACIPLLLEEDLNEKQTVKALLVMASGADMMLHSQTLRTIRKLYEDKQELLMRNVIEVLKITTMVDVRISALEQIFNTINHTKLSEEMLLLIESVAFLMLSSKMKEIRVISLAILKRLGIIYEGAFYNMLNKEEITEQVSYMLRTVQTPDTPSHETPMEHIPDWEKVARSSYNTLWYYFYSVLISIMIEIKPEMVDQILEFALCISKQAFSDNYVWSPITYMTLVLDAYSLQFDPEEMPIIQDCIDFANTVLESKNTQNINSLVECTKFLNFRALPSIVNLLVSADIGCYNELARSISQIIQIPVVFSNTISFLIDPILEFVALLQSYFISIGINSQKNIMWDDNILATVKKNEDICIYYCVIIAAFFNNLQDQLQDIGLTLSNKQIMTKMLIHWVNIPGDFSKIHAYAMNALIPLISSGTIFTDGFEFEPTMLDKLISVQLEGYPVLNSLVLYHVDILLTEFITQYFIRPHRVAQFFAESIIESTENFLSTDALFVHVGPLVLFSQEIGKTNLDYAIEILSRISDLFLSSSISRTIREADNIDFIETAFEFATEQIINFGLNTIKEMAKNKIPIKHFAELITPWFSKVRILPTNSFVFNFTPQMKRFRCFNVLSFFQLLAEVTAALDDEQTIYISMLWSELMKLTDNSSVALVVLYTIEETPIKTKVFQLLCEISAKLVTRFLAKRCRFSFWYYSTTNEVSIDSMMWIIPILQICFSEHLSEAAPFYSTVLHFSLLYSEECYKLCEILFNIFGDDTPDQIEMLGISNNIPDDVLGDVAAVISAKLGEQGGAALEKWSLEAIKWATCCKNFKIATRSMIILNAIDTPIDPFFTTLLKESVVYYLNIIYDDYTQFGKYMKAVFELLSKNIELPQLSSFAFEFASKFVNFEPLFNTASSKALGIFVECFRSNVVAVNDNTGLIIDAFAPFLRDIEVREESRQALETCIELTESPELVIINCVVQRVRDKSIDEVYRNTLKKIKTPNQANKLLKFYAIMLETCSEELLSSILLSSYDILDKFQDTLSENRLIPICRAALKHIVFVESAAKFIDLIAVVNPTIASLEFDSEDGGHNVDEIISAIDQIQAPAGEKSPLTNCKIITQMTGMISQINPPKIYPFDPQMEMVTALRRMKKTEKSAPTHLRRWCSSMNFSSRLVSHKSIISPTLLQNPLLDRVQCGPIEIKKVKAELLNLPNDDDFGHPLLISSKVFLSLD